MQPLSPTRGLSAIAALVAFGSPTHRYDVTHPEGFGSGRRVGTGIVVAPLIGAVRRSTASRLRQSAGDQRRT